MATMDDLIEEMLAEYEPRFILDELIPEAEERLLPRPLRPQWPFTDLDDHVPHPVRLPADVSWVEILNDAKDEFEVAGAAAIFSTWRVEGEDPLDIGDVEIADGMHARAGRLALDARKADIRDTQPGSSLWGRVRSETRFSGRKLKMIGSLKTSLIQSGLRERRARGSSRSLGTQSLAC